MTNASVATLELRILGHPELHCINQEGVDQEGLNQQGSGQQLRFPTRKVLALLIYLALEGEQSRDRLADLLWPDTHNGRAALRTALTHLNTTLQRAGLDGTQADRNTVRLAPSLRLGVDLTALIAAQNNPDTNALAQALANVRGELLEGLSLVDAPAFDEWLSSKRLQTNQTLDAAYERITTEKRDAGQPEEALGYARARIALEPLSEHAHAQVIALHIALGARVRALEAYKQCRTILAQELGVAPGPEIEALVANIQHQPPNPSQDANTPPFVVPQATWQALELGLAQTGLVFLVGGAGLGKTRLTQELARRREPHALFEARPQDNDVPFATLSRELRRILKTINTETLEPWQKIELGRLMPGLGATAAPPARNEADLLRLFDAASEMLWQKHQHVQLLIVEDIQHMDDMSLRVLSYTFGKYREGPQRPLVVVTCREDELRPGAWQFVGSLVETNQASLVRLTPLEPHAVQELLGHIDPKLQTLTMRMHQYTGGNPLFVIETAKILREQDQHDINQDPLPQPQRVTTMLKARFERLSHNARNLLRVAAISDEHFSLELAGGVLQSDPWLLTEANQELENAGLLQGHRFAHELLRQTALETTPPAARKLLHSRVLGVLANQSNQNETSNLTVSLLHHAIHANQNNDIMRFSLEAGHKAFHLAAFKTAIEHYERAMAVAKTAGGLRRALNLQAQQLRQVHFNLAMAYQNLDEHDRAKRIFGEALEWARATGDRETECLALNQLGYLATKVYLELEEAAAMYQESLRIATDINNPTTQIETLLGLVWLEDYRWRLPEALMHAQEADRIAQQHSDQSIQIDCLEALANIELDLGRWQDVREHSVQSLQLALRQEDKVSQAHARTMIAYSSLFLGEPQLGLIEASHALEICQQLDWRLGLVFSARVYALNLMEVGQFEAGQQAAQKAVNCALGLQRPIAPVFALLVLARAHFELAELDAAHDVAQEALRRAQDIAKRTQQGKALVGFAAATLCAIESIRGNHKHASQHALIALEVREANPEERGWYIWTPRWHEVRALADIGELGRARKDVELLVKIAGNNPRARFLALRSLATVEACEGQPQRALKTLEECLNLAESLKLPVRIWPIELQRSRLLQGPEAQRAKDHARAIIQELALGIGNQSKRQHYLDTCLALVDDTTLR